MQAIEVAVQASKKFDRRWLQDMYEQVIFENTVKKITPLVVNPGIVLLSNTTLYFKSYNSIESVSTHHSSFTLTPLNLALNINPYRALNVYVVSQVRRCQSARTCKKTGIIKNCILFCNY